MKLIQGKYLLCALTAIFACGCSESEAVFSEDEPNPQYAIAIAANGSTETAVVDPDDNDLSGLQHVTRVYLYIYEQDADGSDYTCVAGEEVDWQHREGAMTGLNTQWQKYITKYQGYKDNVNYLFLAMGFDDTYTGTATRPAFQGTNSVAAYGQPETIAKIGDKLFTDRNTGYFKLQEGADIKEIAHSELFAGSKVYTRAQLAGKETAEPIDLYRRVAGVAGYFKNVPARIDGVTGVKEVAKVELRLYTSQNTQTYFLPKLPATGTYTSPGEVPDGAYVDYITSPYSYERDSSPVLASYTVGSDQDDNGEFTLSAYLLPIKSPGMFDAGESTLQLTFYDADGLYITHRRILQRLVTTHAVGIIDLTDPEALHYPIRANHFYRIGTKQQPIDLGDSETAIYLEIDPIWDEYYGGAMDNEDYDKDSPGLGLDEEWGEHNGGKLKNEQTD